MNKEHLDVFHLAYEKQNGTACFAPYVDIEVSALAGSQKSEAETVKARLDTGADITCVPATAARKFMPLLLGKPVLIRGHEGKVKRARTHLMIITIVNPETKQTISFRPSRGVLLTDSDIGLIGMDILNKFKLTLDGSTQRSMLTPI